MSAKPETVICKVCGNEIPKKAKICPKCGVKQRRHTVLGIFLVVIGIIIVIAAIGGSSDDTPKKASGTSTSTKSEQKDEKKEESKTPEKTTFGVGETASLNDVVVTLVDVSENKGGDFLTPDDGNVFVVCEFEIENSSSKEITVSSMLCFDAYVDDYATNMSISAQTSSDKNQLDGTVAAGKKMNGIIGYEVPEDWEEIEIHFTPDFWSNKEFIFVAAN